MNGGCVVVGRPHPSHPFTSPHPTDYEIAQVAQIFFPTYEILADEKIDVHPIV